jgi:ABC-type polysaccharide/polyol phosphate transport system ATPase subunit
MMARAKIIILVSHDLENLPRLCDKGLWLDRGQVRHVGPVGDVIGAYREHVEGPQLQAG